MKFEGRLAERWERTDPLTVRFYLRKGVKFHSGNLMTAKDVKWTIERVKTSKDFKALFDAFESPVVIDDHTVDIKTSKPYPLLENMARTSSLWTASSTPEPTRRANPRTPLSRPVIRLPTSTNRAPANSWWRAASRG